MSNALVKWRGPASEAGKRMDTALAKFRQTAGLQKRGQSGELRSTAGGQGLVSYAARYITGAGGEVVDLPRICAVHDKPYAARYITGADGRFHYSQTIRVTEALFLEQYADSPSHAGLHSSELAEEYCPWCGGHGFGSVRCGTCGKEICYGKTTGRYFRCRDSCPGQGTIVTLSRMNEGLTPSSRRGGYGV